MGTGELMRVAVGQIDLFIGNVDKNLLQVRNILEKAEKSDVDILVLPELCNSGYAFKNISEVSASAEPIPEGPVSRELLSWSGGGRLVVAGICERTQEGLYNSAIIVGDGEHLATYHKIHLFLTEWNWFLPGQEEPPVIEYRGYQFGVMVCFDWIFPEVARILTLKGAQVILHPANLVLPYCQDAMITRSIENRVFTATANRVGTERGLTFSGASQITDVKGNRIVQMNSKETGLVWTDIDPILSDDKSITERNDVLADRRPDLYRRITQDD
jgi:predicted amidohydrolase